MDHEIATADDDVRQTPPWRDLSPRQQWGLGAAASIVVVGLLWMVWSTAGSNLAVLPTDQPLTPESARQLMADFRAAGLTGFERDGEHLLVPEADLQRYSALLPSTSTTTDNWASEWERQNQQLTPFSSSRAREATREIARAKLITGMLQKLPDVQQADVVWDEDEQRGWRTAPRVRATVYLMPHPGRVLTLDVIRSVRQAVAGSKKNLDPADVVVMDLARQITYDGDLPVTAGEELLPALRSLAELYRREITSQITQLQGAEVAVRVDLPRFFAFLSEHPHDAEQQLSAAAPDLLRIAVTIPAGSPLAPMEQTRQQLAGQITALTGIGAGASNEKARLAITFENTMTADASQAGLANELWDLPGNWHQQVTAGAGLLLIVLSLLWGRRRQWRERSNNATAFPPLHDVNATVAEWEAAGTLLEFDDLTRLDTAALQSLYTHATPKRWAVALRGSSAEVRDHLAAALPSLDAVELHQECQHLGPVTIGEIEASRQRILESARPELNTMPHLS